MIRWTSKIGDELGFLAFGIGIGMSFLNMRSWASGPRMIQAQDLEEGEACYYKDDTRTNPDIALSYIVRVHSLLLTITTIITIERSYL